MIIAGDDVLNLYVVNARMDGCHVLVKAIKDSTKLEIQMVSQAGVVVDDGLIERSEMFDWIESREDW